MSLEIFIFTAIQLIGMETATLRGLARAKDPGLSIAKEAAEAVPPRKRP